MCYYCGGSGKPYALSYCWCCCYDYYYYYYRRPYYGVLTVRAPVVGCGRATCRRDSVSSYTTTTTVATITADGYALPSPPPLITRHTRFFFFLFFFYTVWCALTSRKGRPKSRRVRARVCGGARAPYLELERATLTVNSRAPPPSERSNVSVRPVNFAQPVLIDCDFRFPVPS